QDGVGGRGDRVRRGARRRRRPRCAPDQGAVEIRRRTRFACRLRQFRRRAGLDAIFLATARAWQWRLDRRDGVCDFRRSSSGALQCHHRRSEQAALCRQLFHRRAGAGRCGHGAVADLSLFPRRRQTAGNADRGLYAADRLPDGVAPARVLRQDLAHARAAGN
ncbi:hypothetical protein KXV85_005640, partial [Aspergillus fumigatus]